jgi:hypothetical protein
VNGQIRADESAAIAGTAFPYEIPVFGATSMRFEVVCESFPTISISREIFATPKWTREGRWTADGRLLNCRGETIWYA